MSRIAIDARLINSSTGHYAEHLVTELQGLDTANEYIVLVRECEKDYWQPRNSNFRVVVADFPSYRLGEQIGLARLLYSLKPDLVHFTMPQQPLLWFGKRITTVHDLILVRFDNVDQNILVYKARKFIFTCLLRNVIWRSRAIITPTDYVKKDIVNYMAGKYGHKIFAIHESGEMSHAAPEPIDELAGKQFLFYIGNAFPYKNVRRVVEAYAQIKPSFPDLHLVLGGKKEFFYQQIEQYVQESNIADVHFPGYISEGEKRWAFQNAQAFVTASLAEGFNIQLLEAMNEHCPVICSNASCLPEVGGDAPMYFDPHSTDDLAHKLTELLGDKALRKKHIGLGLENIKRFSWNKMARQTLSIYQKTLSKTTK